MNKPNDGGPAFPESYIGNDAPHEGTGGGLTKRDWFAGQKMAALTIVNGALMSEDAIAQEAYMQADAMIAEREKVSE